MVGLSVCDCGATTTDVELFIVPKMINNISLKKKEVKIKTQASCYCLLTVTHLKID
jgi:hypothetical protein